MDLEYNPTEPFKGTSIFPQGIFLSSFIFGGSCCEGRCVLSWCAQSHNLYLPSFWGHKASPCHVTNVILG